jgi:hypothetical protein
MKMKRFMITIAVFVMTFAAIGQTGEIVKCRIWKTKDFCTLPDSVNVPGGVSYSNTFIRAVSCSELSKNENLVCVWVTFQGKKATELIMVSHYKNITLVRKDNKEKIHPFAYMERSIPLEQVSGPQYNSKESTMEKCVFELEPQKRYDLFIIFEAGQVGDKLIIDNFLEAVIQ